MAKARVPNFTDKVRTLTRLRSSVNGNPRYKVFFERDTTRGYTTSSDAAFCYGIENPNMRGQVDVYLTPAGRISAMMSHRTAPAVQRTTDELRARGYSTTAIRGITYIQILDDATILATARDEHGRANLRIEAKMGGGYVNSTWIRARCADEAYDRGLIDTTEYDALSNL